MLLGFVAVSVVFLIAKVLTTNGASKEILSEKGTKVIAYYFHGTHRCWSCNTIEKYSREALEINFKKEMESGKLEFKSINMQEEGGKAYIEKYKLNSKSLVLVLVKDDKTIKYKNLPEVWRLVRDREGFYKFVKEKVSEFLQDAE